MTFEYQGELTPEVVARYFRYLVNRFFKILPIRENGEGSLVPYLTSLQRELSGFRNLIDYINGDAQYTALMAKLQWMIDNPDYKFMDFRSEVFGAISICNTLKVRYGAKGEVQP